MLRSIRPKRATRQSVHPGTIASSSSSSTDSLTARPSSRGLTRSVPRAIPRTRVCGASDRKAHSAEPLASGHRTHDAPEGADQGLERRRLGQEVIEAGLLISGPVFMACLRGHPAGSR